MANLKEIRSRISSVGSTMQITSAMKMVSAAKLKRAQDAIVQLRPYADKLRDILQNISSTLDADAGGKLTEQREVKKLLLIVVTSNRGLAGAFNSNVIKKASLLLTDAKTSGAEVELLTVGKKGFDLLRKQSTIYKNSSSLWDNLNFDDVATISEEITEKFIAGEFDQVRIVYNQFKNAATQVIVDEQYLPVQIESGEQTAPSIDYIFEPSKEEIVKDLIPQTLKTQLYKAILDSNASEHGARMTAMHKATDNADSMRRALVLQYNKERQAAITNEILEIVGGAEALNN
ncbi:ATP synthase F1 subunit gamma [Moheibacter sediminis]|uniref:ATP synthase gamma chain n=1 Tax=Moheibacter sediminis TaxID=1434700 RepID=A0A1W2BFG2_9FLAO|nr:ATP synthase F1 subunit gamma [Moheibacter sediminis]SMC71128.1 ATP synthase F1 subcomplex gamma subunit [Moheibacter sediminis]